MQISPKPGRSNQSGFVLVITLTFLIVTLITFASIMYWASSSARVSAQNNLFNTSQAAAQAGAERVIAQMDHDFLYGTPNTTNFYKTLVADIDQSSWPVKFTFSDTNGNANQIYVSEWPIIWNTNYNYLNSQFPGLYGAVANYNLVVVATPTNENYTMSAIVDETLQLAAIPVFQFGVFYNLDLDFSPGQALVMNGKVHCNGTIWMCPQASATFNDVVESAVVVTNKDNPSDQQNLTFNSSYLHYTLAKQPVSHVDSLSLPINGQNANPSNVEAIINLPQTAVAVPNDVAYEQTNQIYLYNACDLIISNSATGIGGTNSVFGTNLSVYFSDYYNPSSAGGRLALLTNDMQWVTSTNFVNPITHVVTTNYLTNRYYSFVTNTSFYDFREGKTVQAVQINVSNFCVWLTNTATRVNAGVTNYVAGYPWNFQLGGATGSAGDKGHPINSIFVYNNVQPTSTRLPAVRVVNGPKLPSPKGLTVATPMPLYVLGNYNIQTNYGGGLSVQTTNTAYTWPAALMGDSVTILSSAWNDTDAAYLAGGSYTSRNAVDTTVNAAALEGIVQSITVSGAKHYSGGLENFLRLLENWGGDTLCYNGSIVVMFPSIYATNYWIGPGNYYGVPTRKWGFDSNFKTPNGSPPCAPAAKALIRGSWSASGK